MDKYIKLGYWLEVCIIMDYNMFMYLLKQN